MPTLARNHEASENDRPVTTAPDDEPSIDIDATLSKLRAIVKTSEGTPDGALQGLEGLVRSMADDGVGRDEPMREVFARLGDKWSMLLLHLLRTGTYRHAVLRRLVSAVGSEGRISQRMLTLRLRALERDGFIERRVISIHPPGVEYSLTTLGFGLFGQIEANMQWIRDHLRAIRAARQRFEADADE